MTPIESALEVVNSRNERMFTDRATKLIDEIGKNNEAVVELTARNLEIKKALKALTAPTTLTLGDIT